MLLFHAMEQEKAMCSVTFIHSTPQTLATQWKQKKT